MDIKSLYLFCTLLMSSLTAYAEQSCALVVVSQNEITLDQEFAAAKNKMPVGYHHQVTTFLNRAFFPMMIELDKVVKNTSSVEINKISQNIKAHYPVIDGTYRRVTGSTVIDGVQSIDADVLRLIDNAYDSYFSVYPRPVFLSKENFQNKTRLHQNLISLTPNIERRKKIGKLHGWFSTTISPVGEYGRKFTEDLMITTQVLSEIATISLMESSNKLANDSPLLVTQETGRGRMMWSEGIEKEAAPLSSLVEGILSFHQLLILTLTEKVPGIETGEEALKAFVFNGKSEQGLTSALVKRIPLAVVGPMANAGVTFKNALVITPDGKLDISQNLQEILSKHQEVAGKAGHPRRVCPMSLLFQGKNPFARESQHDKTGLQNLAEMYWKVFEVVSTSRANKK